MPGCEAFPPMAGNAPRPGKNQGPLPGRQRRNAPKAGRVSDASIESYIMKIVVLDGYTENPGDLSWAGIESFGSVTVYDRTPADAVAARVADAGIVITNKTPVTRATMDACPNIRLIAVLATGYDPVDIAAAKEKGIVVSNVPTYGTDAVGQFAIALLLEIASRVGHHDLAVKQGRWATSPDWCFWDYPLMELAGKTMGIIGFGRIGQSTGRIAKALGMRVIAHDKFPNDSGRAIGEYVDQDTLFAQSDVIALHCNLTEETKHIIRRETIAKMRDGVIIINNSRGPLIAEQDLADALRAGKVHAAGLDVVSLEPITADNPLLTAKNCIITPHISWAPKECRQRIMDITVNNIKAFTEGEPVNRIV
ncbi:D-isomer specific 2-hydroxyacid dehydrogenase [uncultured delta proteobacterium]|uniref:D-isomer specific 2-hydroxyacid dehydrogenase n=1 Tax=uncultured delta proteobacterium TaxID=34034 RepID=A0A212JF65_9DELT|nr:D-isomer specific 2-hydroxyacid dehydrogenase [uncultured delta proteobacterium]